MSETAEIVVRQPESGSGAVLAIIARIAEDPRADIDKMIRLMEMRDRLLKEEARLAFHAAMAEFNKRIPKFLKSKHVNYTTKTNHTVDYWHETLDDVVEAITSALADVGISKAWKTAQDGSKITVSCVLTHALGHSDEPRTLSSGPDDSGGKNAIQAIKSTVTYLQRTTLQLATGTAPKELVQDNDGRGASNPADDGPRLPEAILLERIEWIKECAQSSDVEVQFKAAVKLATEAGDKGAIRDFTGAMLGQCLAWIGGAVNDQTRIAVFKRAYDMADSVGDKEAQKLLRDANDARKAFLRQQGGAK